MSDTFWIIGEIIVGIAILGLLSAAITLVMTRLLTKGPPASAILDERYSRGELTRAQYTQIREDLGIGVITAEGRPSSPLDSRDAGESPVHASRPNGESHDANAGPHGLTASSGRTKSVSVT